MPTHSTRPGFVLQWLALGIGLLFLVANFSYLLVEDRNRILDEEHERLVNRTKIVSENVASELESIKAVLIHARDRVAYWKGHPEGKKLATEYLRTLSGAMLVVRTLLVLDADGAVFASSRKELEGRNFREREYFARAMRNPSTDTLYIGEPFQTALGVYAMNVLCVIRSPTGEFGGVVSVTLNPERLKVLLESVRYRADVSAGLVHGDGKIFLIQPESANAQSVDLSKPGTLFSMHRENGKAVTLVEGRDALTGRERIAAIATIRPPALQMDTALTVGILRDKAPLLAAWRSRAYEQGLLITLLAIASTWGMAASQRRSKQRQLSEEDLANARKLSDDIISSLPGIFYMFDKDGRLVRWNSRFARVTGYTDLELQGKPALDLIAGPDREIVGNRIRDVFEQGESSAEGGLLCKNGTSIPYRFSGQRITFEDRPYLVGVGDDISERKAAENTLRASELRFRSLADRSPLAIQAFSPDGFTLRVNAAWERLWQTPFSALEGYNVLKDQQLEELGILALLKKAFAGETIVFPVHEYDKTRATEIPNSSGRIWLRAFAYPVHGEDGQLLEVVLIQEDITERKRMEDQIHRLAFYDSLTELPNRRLLNDRVTQAMAANKRSGHYSALMFIDLDNFKPLNDKHGHEVGDLLLIEAAERLKNCVREMDTVARFGGDEFVVVLSELTADSAESTLLTKAVAEKIQSALSKPYLLAAKHEGADDTAIEHHCTASIGVTLFKSHEASQEDIFRWADMAMYQAKEAGRNMIRVHDSSIAESAGQE